MNPRKAKTLETFDNISRIHDASIKRSLDIAMNPGTHGWEKSLLTAAIVVPLTGVSAMLTDFTRVLLARSDDEAWDREPPKET